MSELTPAQMERTMADFHAKARLSASDLDLWYQHRAISRFTVTRTAEAFYWEVENGQQCIGSTYAVQSLEVDFTQGIVLELRELETGKVFKVDHYPKRLPKTKLFVWIPYIDAARWARIRGVHQLCISIAVRMPNSATEIQEGSAYLTRKPSV